MTKNDINPNRTKLKAVNAFIFAGSFSVGTIKAGFDLDRVLEIADNQLENNAFYFAKNVTDVPVILPKVWENNAYLDAMKAENIDLMCCNCPCSSLSQINRNASVNGKNNVHFYRLFNIFKRSQPKVFIIENAPTLIALGLPILKDLVKELGEDYRITIIRDKAGNHDVAMVRERTLVVGWNRKHFAKIPLVNMNRHDVVTVKDCIGDLYADTTNDNPSKMVNDLADLYKYVDAGEPLFVSLAKKIMSGHKAANKIQKRLENTKFKKELDRVIAKLKAGKNIWDKSPLRCKEDGYFPSITSVNEYLHPVQDRTLNLREMARIMNYPDAYDFTDPLDKCKIPVTQAIAQGVPVNFGKYIASQARLGLECKLSFHDDSSVDVIFQHNIRCKYKTFTLSEFANIKALDTDKDSLSLNQ